MQRARVWGCATAVAAHLCVACGSSDEATSPASQGSVTTDTGTGYTGTGGGHGTSTHSDSGGSGGAELLGPPYPVVLAHGFFGFEKFAGQDFATYFYELKDHLAQVSGEEVYTPAVDPFNDSAFRGAQLVEAIEAIVAETGHGKVNIIGHSQGGLDARWVAHERPDLVASVVTIATPHGGTPVADIVLKLIADPAFESILDELTKAIGAPLYDQVGDETSVTKPLHLFSEEGIAEFNATVTDRPGVLYASIAGRSDMHEGGSPCAPDVEQPFIAAAAAERDPIDPLLAVTESILDGGLFQSLPNDGLVRVEHGKHGEFWGCIPADHLDEVGQLFGDGPGLGNDWDYKKFYVDLVAALRARGL